MLGKRVTWPDSIIEKLRSYRSLHFSPEETYDFIVQLMFETEDFLLNPILTRTYVEEFGEFKGSSRIVIKNFRIYFSTNHSEILIVAVLFPGEK